MCWAWVAMMKLLGLPPYFGVGLVIWDDGLRDVDVRLRPVFDFNVFLVVGG